LSNAFGEGSRDGTVTISPKVGAVEVGNPDTKQSLVVTVLDANGLRCPGVAVEFEIPQWLEHGLAPFGKKADTNTFETDEQGTVSLLISVPEGGVPDEQSKDGFVITVKATPTGSKDEKKATFPVRVVSAETQ